MGINLTPHKTCTFDCIYCQLGKTTVKTRERKEYISIAEITEELKNWLQNNPCEINNPRFITLSGSGEPTLNFKIADLIKEVKKITAVPVAIITNASLLISPLVRQELQGIDLIVPSLDAVTQAVFEKIDRPLEGIAVAGIIDGLIALKKEHKGQIWLEVMLVRGVNDDLRQIKKLKEAVEKINPDKVQLNSPVRSTAEPNILPVDRKKLKKIKEILGEKCEII